MKPETQYISSTTQVLSHRLWLQMTSPAEDRSTRIQDIWTPIFFFFYSWGWWWHVISSLMWRFPPLILNLFSCVLQTFCVSVSRNWLLLSWAAADFSSNRKSWTCCLVTIFFFFFFTMSNNYRAALLIAAAVGKNPSQMFSRKLFCFLKSWNICSVCFSVVLCSILFFLFADMFYTLIFMPAHFHLCLKHNATLESVLYIQTTHDYQCICWSFS